MRVAAFAARTRRDNIVKRSRRKRYVARRKKQLYYPGANRMAARSYSPNGGMERLALKGGRSAAADESSRSCDHMQQSFNTWYMKQIAGTRMGYSSLLRISRAFAHGYADRDSTLSGYIPLPLAKTAGAVVVASNGERP
ncbi:hypothetical protein RE628_23485 [Paenibacillus sp. D2_2]|uniref:hypothetical protein n=1 Tax=Paenibacillus sp. D2_2 TaxID=3073092 RepID=UPI0028164E58|nr:hypothetical protein [Paenibacillus sp. D2_2]WMT40204.1 hypothetical protein RE628_23485 [Paenibacillus sp. D2_2]